MEGRGGQEDGHRWELGSWECDMGDRNPFLAQSEGQTPGSAHRWG